MDTVRRAINAARPGTVLVGHSASEIVLAELADHPAVQHSVYVAAPTYRNSKLASMWIIAGHEILDAGKRDAYVSAHVDLVRRARQAPGCLDVAITADPVDPRRINSYERWESWDAIEAWRAVAAAPDTDIEISGGEVMAYEIAATRPPF